MLNHRSSSTYANCLALGLVLVGLISGCASVEQYKAEECCPTDLRHTYGHCSNDAVRQMPCYTDEVDFGVKPTVWRCNTSYRPASPCPCVDNCNCQPNATAVPQYEIIESRETAQPAAPQTVPASKVPRAPTIAPESIDANDAYEQLRLEPQGQPPMQSDSPFDLSGANETRPANPFRRLTGGR